MAGYIDGNSQSGSFQTLYSLVGMIMQNDDKPTLFSELRGDFSPLYRTALLDSLPEPVFDRLTAIAVKVLNAPVSLISLVDKDRQFFKSQCGLGEPLATSRETPLSHSFCQHVVVLEGPLIVEDARSDPLVHNNPAVRDVGVTAYLGVPLKDGEGNVIGTFCAIDDNPRKWTSEDLEILEALAAQVTSEISLRAFTLRKSMELKELMQFHEDNRQMAQYVIHDLRAPLTALLLSLELLPLMGPLNNEQRQSLELSRHNGESLQRLIDDLLKIKKNEFAEQSFLNLAEYYPQDLMRFAVDQVAPLATAKDIRLESVLTSSALPFFVDGDKLIRVLVNLIGNAVKFTSTGGTIIAVLEEQEREGKKEVVFSITDNGMGVDGCEAEAIFSKGVSHEGAEREPRSSGLGLPFCKRVVEAHGGSLLLESTPGAGSSFIITLPLPL